MIEDAKVTPNQGFGTKARVEVKVDGQWETLFHFFDDELAFFPGEFIGKTVAEGHTVFHKKDVAYLRS